MTDEGQGQTLRGIQGGLQQMCGNPDGCFLSGAPVVSGEAHSGFWYYNNTFPIFQKHLPVLIQDGIRRISEVQKIALGNSVHI